MERQKGRRVEFFVAEPTTNTVTWKASSFIVREATQFARGRCS
jgi:hypothetical protein